MRVTNDWQSDWLADKLTILFIYVCIYLLMGRSHWPCCLRYGSTAARLLRSWIRNPPGAWISVCCECCMLSGRDLCDELITRPEECYRLWCVIVCDQEKQKNLVNEEDKTPWGVIVPREKKIINGVIHSSVDELCTTHIGWLTNNKKVELQYSKINTHKCCNSVVILSPRS